MGNNRSFWGVMLILFGSIMIINDFISLHGMIPTFIGIGFIAGYVLNGGAKRNGNIGLLIPGCVLIVVGIFSTLQNLNIFPEKDGGIFLVLLGIAFLIIMFVHTLRIESKSWGVRHWPLYPGLILIAIGVLVFLSENYNIRILESIGEYILPVAIILLGISLLLRVVKK